MNETAKHETLNSDPSADVARRLEQLDLAALSFIQLKRFQSALRQAMAEVDQESGRRSAEDNSGDTVRVPSPGK